MGDQVPSPSDGSPKAALEVEKLAYEVRIAQRQLSRGWFALEWLKAGTTLAALAGIAATFYLGIQQLSQAEKRRIDERIEIEKSRLEARFDSALGRVATSSSESRIAGVSSLLPFLHDQQHDYQLPALQVLINAAATETDPRVYSAILEVLRDIAVKEIPNSTLDLALGAALDRNRAIVSLAKAESFERQRKKRQEILDQLDATAFKSRASAGPLNKSDYPSLSLQDFSRLVNIEQDYSQELTQLEKLQRDGLAKIVEKIISIGARATDFSDIFCEKCDFRPLKHLENANFSRSYLGQANFSNMEIKSSDFSGSDLGATIFYGTKIANSNFTWDGSKHNFFIRRSAEVSFPYLKCARLTDVDLSGRVLAAAQITLEAGENLPVNTRIEFYYPVLTGTVFEGDANVEKLSIRVIYRVFDNYLALYSQKSEISPVTGQALLPDPFEVRSTRGFNFLRRQEEMGVHSRDFVTRLYLTSELYEEMQAAPAARALLPFLDEMALRPVAWITRLAENLHSVGGVPEAEKNFRRLPGNAALADEQCKDSWVEMEPAAVVRLRAFKLPPPIGQ